MLFWRLFPSLLRNSGNKHKNNPLVSAETVRHTHTYIIPFILTAFLWLSLLIYIAFFPTVYAQMAKINSPVFFTFTIFSIFHSPHEQDMWYWFLPHLHYGVYNFAILLCVSSSLMDKSLCMLRKIRLVPFAWSFICMSSVNWWPLCLGLSLVFSVSCLWNTRL